ncbi:MAG: acyltransferase [Polyangiaceae bacterium]|nr:acyltransferase [Polyangiaceae bacterium]
MKYRAEIDGLRAVAVVPVILFHAGFESFSGGYVGVDVFFVISGYLITSIILAEKEEGRFSLVAFYERRARRILPPLFFVIALSLPFAWIWLFPPDMLDFAQSVIAVPLFGSNILFWRETGYWGAANEFKPLLHTWSLAVEEQYYILFPLFLGVMWRFQRRWLFLSLLLIAAMSLATAQWGSRHHAAAAFFLLPTRAWELAIGACIAFIFLYRKDAVQTLLGKRALREVMGAVGLLMIVFSIFAFDEKTPFPSVYALLPTLGTGLLIFFSSPETLVGRWLGAKVLVGIGLVSYSAYLWHQPLFAFARHASLTEPSRELLVALAVTTFPLAYLSWRFVEKPFRSRAGMSRKTIFSTALAGSAALIALGLAGYATDGFIGRTSESELSLEAIEDKRKINHGLDSVCEGTFTLSPHCRTSDQPEILLWGDSFAMHLAQGLLASKPDAKFIQMTKSVCGPFFDVAPMPSRQFDVPWARGCLEFTAQVRDWLKANDTIKYAVLSSPFYSYAAPDQYVLLRDGRLEKSSLDLAVRQFESTLNELKAMGISPVVFSPLPGNDIDLGRCLARSDWTGESPDACDFPVGDMSPRRLKAFEFLERIGQRHKVVRLDRLICDDSRCPARLGSTYLYRDPDHLSHEGSASLGRKYNFFGLIVGG